MSRNGAYDVALENEIILGGIAFPTTGPVRVANITVVPNPIVLGDTSRQTETQVVSQFIQPDASSGIGVNRANARIEFDRAWTSEAETRYSHQVTLPGLVTDLGRPAGETAPPFWIGRDANLLTLAIFGMNVYTLVGTTWTLDYTLISLPTDAMFHNKGLYIGSQGGVMHLRALDGTWTTATGINVSLLLSSAYGPSTAILKWYDPYQQMMRSAGVGMLTEPGDWLLLGATFLDIRMFEMVESVDFLGRSAVYLVGDTGVFLFLQPYGGPASGTGLFQTSVRYPRLPAGRFGRTACIFGQDLVIPQSELGLLALRLGTGDARKIGLDQEDGVPGSRWGVIDVVAAGVNFLYALVTHRGLDDTAPRDLSVYAFDGHWHYVAGLASGLLDAAGTSVQGHVMTVLSDGIYVGYMTSAGIPNIRRIDGLDKSVTPKQIGVSPTQTRFNFAPGPVEHITPWYDLGSEIQAKLMLKLEVQAEATATETIQIFYAIDLDETTWTELDTITTSGLHVLDFNGPLGRQMRLVRFKYILRREAGANDYKRPLLEFAVLEFMRLLPATYGFAVELDLTRSYKGRTAVQLLDDIKRLSDLTQTPELIPFTYADDQRQEPQTYYVRISRMTGQEYSGRRGRGVASYMVSLMSPYGSDSV